MMMICDIKVECGDNGKALKILNLTNRYDYILSTDGRLIRSQLGQPFFVDSFKKARPFYKSYYLLHVKLYFTS